MMKTTQFLTNIKLWQNAIFAFLFLFSLTTFSQVDAASAAVGDELTFNGMVQTSGDEGVSGSGNGSLPNGWNAAQGVNYAPTNNNTTNGACHSEDRQWKFNAVNGNNGSFINQQITNLPAGTFTYDYWTKWSDPDGVVAYVDQNGDTLEPKFTIRVLQSDGSYSVVHEEVIPLSADQVWTQTTGTWENTDAGATVRLQWYKRGGTNANPTGMNQPMSVDSVSFTYSAEVASVDCSFDVFLESGGSYPSEVSWAIQDASGTDVMTGDGYNTDVQTLEMSYGDTYTLVMTDSYGDGWNGASISVNGVSYTVPSGGSEATAEIVCSSEPSMTVNATTDGDSAFIIAIALSRLDPNVLNTLPAPPL